MKLKKLTRALTLLFGLIVLAIPAIVRANGIVSVTLAFEVEGVDLDTNTVAGSPGVGRVEDLFLERPDLDLKIAYHGDRSPHAVVIQNQQAGLEIDILDGTPFNLVGASILPDLSFASELVDHPFGTDDTVVIRTDAGHHYKLGNPIEDQTGVTFDYERLDPPSAALWGSNQVQLVELDDRSQSPSHLLPLAAELNLQALDRIAPYIRDDIYRITQIHGQSGKFEARNPRHSLHATFDAGGVHLGPLSAEKAGWHWGLRLESYGYERAMLAPQEPEIVVSANRIEYRRGELVEWYVNDETGLEQGFTLSDRPGFSKEHPLLIEMTLDGSMVPSESGALEQEILFAETHGDQRLRYSGLLAWDANDKPLLARMELGESRLVLRIDDSSAVYPINIDPTIINEEAKLLASDGGPFDQLGFSSISISSNTVVVGVPLDRKLPRFAGSVYLFEQPSGGWAGIVNEAARLLPTDGAAGDQFGFSVSVSSNTVVVGAHANDDNGSSSGSVYVFEEPVAGWAGTLNETVKLLPSDGAARDDFGMALALAGDVVVVGAPRDDDNGTDSGSAYVFERIGTTWVERAKLLASDGAASHDFGRSVSISGTDVVVGAPAFGGNGTGSAYVFQEPVGGWSGTLTEDARLLASDGALDDGFGFPVAISGDTLVVAAVNDDTHGQASGVVYLFEKPLGGWSGTLNEDAKLLASDGTAFDTFGFSTAISGTRVLVGAQGNDDSGLQSGSAYVFKKPLSGWSGIRNEAARLIPSDIAAGDLFGVPLAISGDTAVVGAQLDDDNGTDSGSAYIFEVVLTNQPPFCNTEPEVLVECSGGNLQTVSLNGSASFDPNNDPLTFSWTTDCPSGAFDDSSSATPVLTVDALLPGVCAPLNCTATLTVIDDSGESDTCAPTQVQIEDTEPPMVVVDTTPITVTDFDCSGDEAVALPTANATDICDPSVVVSTTPPPTFVAGQTATVAYSATDDCGNTSSPGVDVTVLYGSDIVISANRHTVGSGSHPGSTKEPLTGIEVCAYDKSEGSCSRSTCGGISHQEYQCIVDSCDPVNSGFNAGCCVTDASGECTINAPPGDYIVISDDATKTVLPDPLGVSASNLVCGEVKQKHLQQIVRADGKKLPATTTIRTGSELLVIEPEFVEWSGEQELYPIVFDSLGDWEVTTSVAPPEGFVADYESLSETVVSEVEAVQFTITDIGSEWIPTEIEHFLSHNGRRETVLSRVGVRLTPGLAQAKGLDRDGHPLAANGTPQIGHGHDPRGEWPVEIAGWIEPSTVDSQWTVKLKVHRTTDLTLAITRGRGRVVQTLASGIHSPGEYSVTWNDSELGAGRYFLSLVAGDVHQEKMLMELTE